MPEKKAPSAARLPSASKAASSDKKGSAAKIPEAKPSAGKVPAPRASSAKLPSASKIPLPRASAGKLPTGKVVLPKFDITVGCAGFPVPATRYFKEFVFVEVQDTHQAIPGMGTIRRWRREAPPGFRFTLVAPREIGLDGFKTGKIAEASLQALADIGRELDSQTAVLLAPPEFAPSRSNRTIAKDFLKFAVKKFKTVVWDAPHWPIKESEAIAEETGAIAARDPLTAGLSTLPIAYYRMPGPAGHKSRYEDQAIERLGELARKATHKEATYVFTNVDMFADAKRLKKILKLP